MLCTTPGRLTAGWRAVVEMDDEEILAKYHGANGLVSKAVFVVVQGAVAKTASLATFIFYVQTVSLIMKAAPDVSAHYDYMGSASPDNYTVVCERRWSSASWQC